MSYHFSVIVPIYNEERTLRNVIEKVETLPEEVELIFVNDGSQDKTQEILNSYKAKGFSRVQVVTHERNQGKGAAVKSGLAVARGQFAGIQDADLEYDVNDLMHIFSLLEQGKADVIFGSRFLTPNPALYWRYKMGNRVMTLVANLLGRGRLTDSYTCYKAMSLRYWKTLDLSANGFELEAEITMKCLMAKWKLMEVPIRYAPRSFEGGKKIRSKDAWKGMGMMMRCRFSGWSPQF